MSTAYVRLLKFLISFIMNLCISLENYFFFCYWERVWGFRLEEAQAGIKIVRRNINNLRYGDDTILMAESEE